MVSLSFGKIGVFWRLKKSHTFLRNLLCFPCHLLHLPPLFPPPTHTSPPLFPHPHTPPLLSFPHPHTPPLLSFPHPHAPPLLSFPYPHTPPPSLSPTHTHLPSSLSPTHTHLPTSPLSSPHPPTPPPATPHTQHFWQQMLDSWAAVCCSLFEVQQAVQWGVRAWQCTIPAHCWLTCADQSTGHCTRLSEAWPV